MRNQNGKFATLLVFALASLLVAAHGQGKPEAYSGVAKATGGAGGMVHFDLTINAYNTDEEIGGYATLFKEKGQGALRLALEKEIKGRLTPAGSLGIDVAVASKEQQGANTVITIVTARVMPFSGAYQGANRSTDYPFGFMQITLNEKGEGTGTIISAAKLKFDKRKAHMEIESLGGQPIGIPTVRAVK